MSRGALALLALSSLLACGEAAPSPSPSPSPLPSAPVPAPPSVEAVRSEIPSAADPALDALFSIESESDWRRLAAPSDEHAIARTEVVKVLFDRARDALHFCQSERWPLHYDYLLHLRPEERERYPTMRAVLYGELPARRSGLCDGVDQSRSARCGRPAAKRRFAARA